MNLKLVDRLILSVACVAALVLEQHGINTLALNVAITAFWIWAP